LPSVGEVMRHDLSLAQGEYAESAVPLAMPNEY
jgi:hypothetical protein